MGKKKQAYKSVLVCDPLVPDGEMKLAVGADVAGGTKGGTANQSESVSPHVHGKTRLEVPLTV